MKPIKLSSLKKQPKPRARLPGEPRPFRPAKEPKRELPRMPPIHEPRTAGPDEIRQLHKEAKLREILESSGIYNQQLFNQLVKWEKS